MVYLFNFSSHTWYLLFYFLPSFFIITKFTEKVKKQAGKTKIKYAEKLTKKQRYVIIKIDETA